MTPPVLLSPALAPPSPPFTLPTDESLARIHVACRQWTGPMRAIVPLPRRCSQPIPSGDHTKHRRIDSVVVRPTASRTRCVRDVEADGSVSIVMDTASDADARGEKEDEDVHAEYGDENDARRCCSYESITAAMGLDAWSFEELRTECYAQSQIARGTKPPAVDKPSLVIPPAFVPRVVLQTRVDAFSK